MSETATSVGRAAGFVAPLLERESELGAIEELLQRAGEGSGAALVVTGHAGIGKTRLLERAVDHARDEEWELLRARGVELQRELAFGVALQLFEPSIARASPGRRRKLLSGAAARARPLLAPQDAAPLVADELGHAVLHGLLWVASNLADRSPLLIAVDDAHWADAPSLRFILYLLERIDELPIALVIAVRRGEHATHDDLMMRVSAHGAAQELEPGPLSTAAVGLLLRRGWDDRAGQALAHAGRRVTMGNPFLVRQLISDLRREGATAGDEAVLHIETLGPAAIARSVLLRVARLPAGAGQLVRATAVLGDGCALHDAAELAGVALPAAAHAADALAASNVLEPGEPLTFVHAIVRQAIYDAVPSHERSHAHAKAARLLARRGAGADAVASHLLVGTRTADPWAARVLREAAAAAAASGAPDVALPLLRRALDEPPPANERGAVLVELGRVELMLGNQIGRIHFQEAIALEPDLAQRTRLRRELLHMILPSQDAAAEVLEEGLADAGDDQPELAAVLLPAVLCSVRDRLDPERADALLEWLVETAPQRPESERERAHVLESLLVDAQAVGPRERILERLVEVTGPALEHAGEITANDASVILVVAGELRRAIELFEARLALLREAGELGNELQAYAFRSWPHLLAGEVDSAIADSSRALELERLGWAHPPFVRADYAAALLEGGRPDEAEAALAAIDEQRWRKHVSYPFVFETRGRIALARGRSDEALEWLERAGAEFSAGDWGPEPNPGLSSWRELAAVAAARAGRRGRAHELAAEALALAERWGTHATLGTALWALAHCEQGDKRVATLERAVAEFGACDHALARWRAELDLAEAVLQSGRRAEAVEQLHTTRAAATRCGAHALARVAQRLLEVTGESGKALRGWEAVTAGERKVVELAAQGFTNREVAERLFVTIKAVEWHLRNAYPKLGVRRKAELAEALRRERVIV